MSLPVVYKKKKKKKKNRAGINLPKKRHGYEYFKILRFPAEQ